VLPAHDDLSRVRGSHRVTFPCSTFLRDSKDEFIRIEFDMRGAETLVFPRAELVAATDDLLTGNGVRSQRFADSMKWPREVASVN